MKQYTGAIFDMDGVLFDTERVYQKVWQEIAAERGVVLGPDFMRTISGTNGSVMRQIVQRFYRVPDGAEIIREVMRRVRQRLSAEVPVKPGAPQILAFLHDRGMCLAVASSSAREQVVSNLALTGLERWFDAIVSGEDVSAGKPAPDIFLSAARSIGCAPERCFVFEDSLSGVRAGHAAGCDTIMVPDRVPPVPDIRPLCFRVCDSLFEAMDEVRALLDGAGGALR